MKEVKCVTLLIALLIIILTMCSGCPSVGGGPPSSGMFTGETGWSKLKPAPSPPWTNSTLSVYPIKSFESHKNIASSNNPAYRVHPAELIWLIPLKQSTNAIMLNAYPKQYRDGTYLQAEVGLSFISGTQPTDYKIQSFGDESVYLLKWHNLPSGSKWLAKTKIDSYFIEIP